MKKAFAFAPFGLVIAMVLMATPSALAQANPGVLPPNSNAYGMTYAEWSARWWQWAISLPLDNHPLNDTAPCSTGQLGKVWFLGAQFGSNGKLQRTCVVPLGKALFFPIVDVECSNLEPFPFYGGTPAERTACAKMLIDTVQKMSVQIDGRELKNLYDYRAVSPDFNFVAPPDGNNNVLGVPGGPGQSVGDGYYLLLAPLSKGVHTIHFEGNISYFGPGMTQETYTILVQ